MAEFYVNIEKIINSSQDIASIAVRLKKLQNDLGNINLTGILEGQSRCHIDQSIRQIYEKISNEAAKMDSLGNALQVIADKYRETEKTILDVSAKNVSSKILNAEPVALGSDKRNAWNKFWDWITSKEPDVYDTTTIEQEKAADAAIKKKLWNVLQDEKYSPENWDNSSVDERKQILQDYMDEVIKIYGLQDIDPKIHWDYNATYTDDSITWGSYKHGLFSHKVKLNARALTDSVGNWDSYNMFATISHELRHAYQHEAIDHPTDYMVSKETIDTWKKNFKDYISPEKSYSGYRNQPVEVDARDFEISRDDEL